MIDSDVLNQLVAAGLDNDWAEIATILGDATASEISMLSSVLAQTTEQVGMVEQTRRQAEVEQERVALSNA